MYQVSHPVEVGTFGRFRFGGKELVELWYTLEDLFLTQNLAWIGVYSAWDLLTWAKNESLLSERELKLIEGAL